MQFVVRFREQEIDADRAELRAPGVPPEVVQTIVGKYASGRNDYRECLRPVPTVIWFGDGSFCPLIEN